MAPKLTPEMLAQHSSRRPWHTILIWEVALVVALVLKGTLLSGALTTQGEFTNQPEAKQADELLEQRLRGPRRLNEIAIVRSDTMTVEDAVFKEQVTSLSEDLMALGPEIIEGGTNYYQTGDESLVSADRHTTILPFIMAGDFDAAADNIQQVHQVIHGANDKNGIQTLITGEASFDLDSNKVAEEDLRNGEGFGILVALVILVLVFGTLGAVPIPIGLAVISIFMALGTAALLGQVFSLSFFVTNMITMIGLAVGIDYSLFIVGRYREERQRGLPKVDAIQRAGATASRAVLFSGMTVVLALCGMLIVPTTIYRSLAAGAILVVIFAMLASLTLLPALLSLWGDKVNAWRIPVFRRREALQRGGFWNWIVRGVMRHPVISLVLSAGLLIAAAVPYFDINTGFAGVDTLPDRFGSKQGFLILQEEFSAGLVAPAEIVIDGSIDSPAVQEGLNRLKAALAEDPNNSFGPAKLEVNPARDLALLSVPVAGEINSAEAIAAIERLRHQYVPQAFRGAPAEVLVGGVTAYNKDFFDLADQYQPIVFAFVLGLSFVLLMLVFRSLVVPLKAIIMNLLSVGAAYGLMVLVFQKGMGADLLGFRQVPTVEAWIPLFLFSVLFGLSMDYQVFLLSRIREHFDQTRNNTEAVAFGLRSTAGIITGAALIMVAVFGGFASGELVMFQQVGFGLGVAVLLDATIVRSVLVPASMKLLGRANWYLPRALHWLPDLRPEGATHGPVTASGDQAGEVSFRVSPRDTEAHPSRSPILSPDRRSRVSTESDLLKDQGEQAPGDAGVGLKPAPMTVIFDDKELYNALKIEAAKRGRDAKDIVVEAVREWLGLRQDEELKEKIEEARREWQEHGGMEAEEFLRQLQRDQQR